MLRSTGVPYDLRKHQPYEIYEDVMFNVPSTVNGDSYDRYVIRVQEMRESLRIIEQCVRGLPEGDTLYPNFKVVPPTRRLLKSSMENLINQATQFYDREVNRYEE